MPTPTKIYRKLQGRVHELNFKGNIPLEKGVEMTLHTDDVYEYRGENRHGIMVSHPGNEWNPTNFRNSVGIGIYNNLDNFKILGKPLEPHMILMALEGIELVSLTETGELRNNRTNETIVNLDLSKPISSQTEEVLEKIYSLI